MMIRCVLYVCSRLADYMGDDVKYVITNDNWDDTFDTVSLSPLSCHIHCLLTGLTTVFYLRYIKTVLLLL